MKTLSKSIWIYFTGKNGGRNTSQTLELPRQVREVKVRTTGSWSQEQDSHQCCSSWHFLRPQAQRPVPIPAPVCVTLGKSSNISVPQVSSCKWSCPRPCKNGAPGLGQESSSTELGVWERKKWASKRYKSYNNTIANKPPNVTARRALTYVRAKSGFVLSVVS